MTDLYGVNYTKAYVNKPSEKAGKGEYNGHVKVLFDEHTFVADVNSISDTVYIGKLPAGARVLAAYTICGSTGTTGIYNVGYRANGVDSADPDAFVVGADAGGQAVSEAGAGAALGKKFTAETTVLATLTEATDSASDVVVQVWVEYIVD